MLDHICYFDDLFFAFSILTYFITIHSLHFTANLPHMLIIICYLIILLANSSTMDFFIHYSTSLSPKTRSSHCFLPQFTTVVFRLDHKKENLPVPLHLTSAY